MIPLSPLQLALFPQSVVWVVIYSMFLPWRLSPLLSPILFPHWAAASYFGTLCPFSWARIANPDLDYERLLLHIATTINTVTTSTTFNLFTIASTFLIAIAITITNTITVQYSTLF